jgi:tetrapyrrole methylase family protein/MazG family protein
MDLDSNSLQAIAGQTFEQILPDAEKTAEAFKLFYTVVARLRAPDGCPWDLEQTPSSIRGNIIEEAYELAEAITENDNPHIEEETGDLYLLATMVAYMGQQEGRYTVADSLCEGARKLIRRHPHVFGESDIHSPDQVVRQWNEIKERVEGRRKKDSLLDEVHRHLPPLEKAYKLQKKAAKAGFDWQNSHDIWNKLEEELAELKQARAASEENAPDSGDALEEEFGDLLFTVINAARLYGIDPSIALHRANEKFSRRFRHVETRMKQNHLAMSPEYFEQMDAFWNEAKREEDAGETSSKVTKRQP